MISRAYWGFAANFKDQADILLNSLDSTYRRMLQAGDLSNSSSSNSLNTAGRTTSSTMPRSRQSSVTGSSENLIGGERRTSTLTRKSSGIPLYTSPLKTDGKRNGFFDFDHRVVTADDDDWCFQSPAWR